MGIVLVDWQPLTYFSGCAGQSAGRSLVSRSAKHQHDQCLVCHQLNETRETKKGGWGEGGTQKDGAGNINIYWYYGWLCIDHIWLTSPSLPSHRPISKSINLTLKEVWEERRGVWSDSAEQRAHRDELSSQRGDGRTAEQSVPPGVTHRCSTWSAS